MEPRLNLPNLEHRSTAKALNTMRALTVVRLVAVRKQRINRRK